MYWQRLKKFGWLVCMIFLNAQNALGNVVGSDFQNFNPTSNGLDFVTVHSARSLSPGVLNLGLFFNYAVNPLPEFNLSSREDRGVVRNLILGMDLSVGYGLTKGIDVGISMPFTMRQDILEDVDRLEFSSNGLNQFRFNAKFHLLSAPFGNIAAVTTVAKNMIKNNPFEGDGSGASYILEGIYDTKLGSYPLAFNLGYKRRKPGKIIANDVQIIEPMKDQYLYSFAVSRFLEPWNTHVIGEVFGSLAADSKAPEESKKNMNSSEMLLGAKYVMNHNLMLHMGMGTYLKERSASPDWRVYAGINWTTAVKDEWPPPQDGRSAMVVIDSDSSGDTSGGVSEVIVLSNFLFEFDSAKIAKDQVQSIERVVDKLRVASFSHLVVEGHTDSLGSDEYNKKLSLRRAQTIANYIVKSMKLSPARVKAFGFGEEKPVADNGSYQGRHRNRRVEVKIFSNKS